MSDPDDSKSNEDLHRLHVDDFRQALKVWDVSKLLTFRKSGLSLKSGVKNVCQMPGCGCLETSTIMDRLVQTRLTRTRIDQLFGWGILSPTESIPVLARILESTGTYGIDILPSDVFYLMKKFDKKTLGEWRSFKSASTVGHILYWGMWNEGMYCSSMTRYLVDECGMDPKVEGQEYGDDGFKPLPEGERGQNLLEVASKHLDLATVFYLLEEKGCDPNIHETFDLKRDKGRDPLMELVWSYTKTFRDKAEAKHKNYCLKLDDGSDIPEDFCECQFCNGNQTREICDLLPDIFAIIKEYIRHGYDVKRTDNSGKPLEDHIADMVTRGPGGFMIDWYREFKKDPLH